MIPRARRSYRAVRGRLQVQRGAKPHCNFSPMSHFLDRRMWIAPVIAAALVSISACERSTARLSADRERQFQNEGVRRRADDLVFRWTRDAGGRDERREDRRASIVVTSSSLLIHKNEKIGVEITPRTRKETAVERSGDRIRIRSGRGRSEEIWSFVAPDDAPGWAADIRNVIKLSESTKRD